MGVRAYAHDAGVSDDEPPPVKERVVAASLLNTVGLLVKADAAV